jgi:UDPglucose 6-dehydrogenase
MTPDRIVIGSNNRIAAEAVAALFESLPGKFIFCSWASAELSKYAANALLATKISFINEIAVLAESLNADIEDVASVLRTDPRIGSSYLQAGLGWGGSCFPKDVRALAWMAQSAGFESSIAEAAFLANTRQRNGAVNRILARVLSKPDPTVAVLGLAFKPDTDDLREAPALDVIRMLVDAGVRVRAHDPQAMENARPIVPEITYCANAYEAAKGADLLFLATEWREYVALDWKRIRAVMNSAVVFDGRHVLDKLALSEVGFEYLSFGRFVPDDTYLPEPALEAAEAESAVETRGDLVWLFERGRGNIAPQTLRLSKANGEA